MNRALPAAFAERVKNDPFLGNALLDALETTSPTAIRRNPWKTRAALIIDRPIPWSRDGFFLKERPKFTLDPLFHAGTYYPQEAGSQLLDAVLQQLVLPEASVILDLCAAPGGKSTLIASHLNNSGLLVSNEVIQARAKVLKENLIKWGATNTLVTNNDPADFGRIPGTFDCIVVDAPCSGEGMFRKDHAARDEWSANNVDLCSSRQRRIVMDVWPSLKPEGYLIYSTCTFNAQENEANVAWFAHELNAEIVRIALPFARADRQGTGWYALPSELDTEGFYISVLRKKETGSARQKPVKNAQIQFVRDLSPLHGLVQAAGVSIVQWTDFLFAIPEAFRETVLQVHQQLRVIKLGTELGQQIRKGFIPHESLALSSFLRLPDFPKTELTKDQALAYLRGDTFPIEGTHGYRLMTYENEPLGWIKHLGNRFNNLYPKEWRIRMRID